MSATTRGWLSFHHPSAISHDAADRVAGLGRRIAGTLGLWRRRIREREALRHFSYHDMRDIGVTRSDIAWETSQPFWREARRR